MIQLLSGSHPHIFSSAEWEALSPGSQEFYKFEPSLELFLFICLPARSNPTRTLTSSYIVTSRINMSSLKHFNPKAGSPPYKSLFSNVTIVPPNTTLAYISTQWAADSETGELVKGCEGDAGKQAQIIWTHIVGILKELGAEMKDVVHKTVSFT